MGGHSGNKDETEHSALMRVHGMMYANANAGKVDTHTHGVIGTQPHTFHGNAPKSTEVEYGFDGGEFKISTKADAPKEPSCPTCKGSGKIRGGGMTCPACHGSGDKTDE